MRRPIVITLEELSLSNKKKMPKKVDPLPRDASFFFFFFFPHCFFFLATFGPDYEVPSNSIDPSPNLGSRFDDPHPLVLPTLGHTFPVISVDKQTPPPDFGGGFHRARPRHGGRIGHPRR